MPCASSLAGETWSVTTSPFRMIYSSLNPGAMLTVSKKTAGGGNDDDRARRDLGEEGFAAGVCAHLEDRDITEPGDSPREG
jgi:hypothetical protein